MDYLAVQSACLHGEFYDVNFSLKIKNEQIFCAIWTKKLKKDLILKKKKCIIIGVEKIKGMDKSGFVRIGAGIVGLLYFLKESKMRFILKGVLSKGSEAHLWILWKLF